MRIRQEQGEPLRDYWRRFNDEMIQISELEESVAFAVLKNGILDKGMIYDIRRDKPYNLADLIDRIRFGIEAEEAVKQKYGDKRKRPRDDKTLESSRPPKKGNQVHNNNSTAKSRDTTSSRSQTSQVARYTPLNVPRKELLQVMEKMDVAKFPRFGGRPSPVDRDMSKWCAYHKEHGHETESCRCEG